MATMWKRHLRPYVGDSAYDKEPFDEWYTRVAQAIPGIPRDLAEHWLYENWGGLPYPYLSMTSLTATHGTLTLSQALDVTVSSRWGAIKPGTAYLDGFVAHKEWLAVRMHDTGTWPVPIVVLDNMMGDTAPGDAEIGPLHLLEGHRRLTFLHGLAAAGKASSAHSVWLVKDKTPIGDAERESSDDEWPTARVEDLRLKFDEAVKALAIGPKTIQARLHEAFMSLSGVRPHELGEWREDWQEMHDAWRRVPDKQRGSIAASTEAMGDREASHRARTIVDISRWLGEPERAMR